VDEPASVERLRDEIEELRASRARIAATADGERRRIERALHDGVQQDLIALAVNLQLARGLADSQDVSSYLEAASRDVHDALDGVRALGQSVYPSLLIDRGLAEALRGAARTAHMPTSVDAPEDRYPPEIEAAVYFTCVRVLDAVEARRARVRVWSERGSLLFEVAVEGGLVPESAELEDRAGAAGGSLSFFPAGVRGTIPLPQ
jgi:signal transduction histidine kinase